MTIPSLARVVMGCMLLGQRGMIGERCTREMDWSEKEHKAAEKLVEIMLGELRVVDERFCGDLEMDVRGGE